MQQPDLSKGVWLVYDGECPICTPAVNAFKIRQSVGELHVVNAREDHPIHAEIIARGFDLDKGMVLKMGENFYHGPEALHVCALIGSDSGFFNKLNVWLFRSRLISRLIYPIFCAIKDTALKLKGVPQIKQMRRT